MEKTTNKTKLISKLYCDIVGHNYQVTRDVTLHVKEYTCKNCKKQLTTSGKGHLTELTPKFKEINDVLERIHYKRIVKISKKKNLLVFKH